MPQEKTWPGDNTQNLKSLPLNQNITKKQNQTKNSIKDETTEKSLQSFIQVKLWQNRKSLNRTCTWRSQEPPRITADRNDN